MGKYMLGVEPKEMENSFPNGIKRNSKGTMWTGYKIDTNDEIWIKKLQSDGDIIARAKIVSTFRRKHIPGNAEDGVEFELIITSIRKISPKKLFNKCGITANANHGRIE